jgi:signal transduction histidine kinase
MLALAPVEHRLLGMLSSRFEHLPGQEGSTSLNRDRGGTLERLGANEELPPHQLSESASDKVGSELDHAAKIAHEVKQPLSAIVINGETCLRWLDRAEPDLNRACELIKRLIGDARRASKIIERFQMAATEHASRYASLPFNDIIEESIVFLRHEFQSKNIAVSLDLAPDLPPVLGDRIQLQQVVVNLAVNAIQAVTGSTRSRRTILVRTVRSLSETVRCSIEDDGPGIEPTHLPHIFGNFFTTKSAGMGLGLPISQSIVEAHGGRIEADNDSGLGGARFTLTLPVEVND